MSTRTKYHTEEDFDDHDSSNTDSVYEQPKMSDEEQQTFAQKRGKFDSKDANGKAITKQSCPNINIPRNYKIDRLVGAFLCRVPVLAQLTEDECAILAGAMTVEKFHPGAVIIKQGDKGEGFYIMKDGQAQVKRKDPETKEIKTLDNIFDLDYFGEAALINNSVRGASVIAVTYCETLFLHRDRFHELFTTPEGRTVIAFAKRQGAKNEKKDSNNNHSTFEIREPIDAVRDKDPKIYEMLYCALKDQVLFAGMEDDHKKEIINKMWRVKVPRGKTVITQGDLGDNLYVLEKGKMDVYIRTADGKGMKKVDTMKTPGKCFGELALIYNTPRNATIVASSKSTLWVLDRITFRRILRNVTDIKIRQYEEFMQSVELLAPLSRQERIKVAEAVDAHIFKDGEAIVTQGDVGDALYFICAGSVRVTRRHDNEEFEVNRLLAGDYFGERCLLEPESLRTATVYAVGRVEVAKLDRYAFQLLLNPVMNILEHRQEVNRARDAQVARTRKSITTNQVTTSRKLHDESNFLTTPRPGELANMSTKYKLEDLEVIGFLGKGGYGYVELVRHVKTMETFALKTLYRSHIIKTSSTHNVVNEKKMLVRMDSNQIIRLFATFKDATRLYFLLEPALGGELFTLLRMRTVFNDKTARFYAASVILGLEEIHTKDVVYRDLKPENLLLDAEGYIKITDFGLSKYIPENRTTTVCGTPHYLSPEIISGAGHGKPVDLWCLGVLIYEMLAGRPPFYRPGEKADHMKIYRRVTTCDYHLLPTFSPDASDLICRLLQLKPQHRIGNGTGGFERLKKHPWFIGLDWNRLSDRSLRAPIIPFIRTNDDLHNFKKPTPNYKKASLDIVPDSDQSWDAEF